MTGAEHTADDHLIRVMAERDWVDALRAGDVDRLLALCADDLVYMPADHPPLRGHDQFRAWVANFPRIREMAQPVEHIEVHGDAAMVRAGFTVALDANGQRLNASGKALCSLRREPGKGWRVTSVCWNFDAPPAPGA